MSYTPPTLAIVAVTKTADGLYRAKSARWNTVSILPDLAAQACARHVLECPEHQIHACHQGDADGAAIYHCTRA